jgi:hypothetical protein
MAARGFLLSLVSAAALFAACAPAHAQDGWGDGIEVMGDEEMTDLRGGIAVGGIEFGLGATITSTVNGAPVLTTTFTWTDAGAVMEQVLSGVGKDIKELTPEQQDALGLGGLEGAGGVVIEDEDGVTAFVHNVTDGALQNIIVNTATGRELGQEVDVTLTLPGFEYVQSELLRERFGLRIADDFSSVIIGPGY